MITDGLRAPHVGSPRAANPTQLRRAAIADKWLIAGIAWAAGTATAESGIGAVVGYGVAGLQVVQMLKLFNDASTKIGKYGAIVAGIFVGGMDIGYKNRIQEWRPIHRPAPVSLLHKPRSLS
jgi:hypothetical protein